MARICCQVLVQETEGGEPTERSQTEEEILSRKGKRLRRHLEISCWWDILMQRAVADLEGGPIILDFMGVPLQKIPDLPVERD